MPKQTYIVRVVDSTDMRVIWSSEKNNELYTNMVAARRRGKWVKYVLQKLSDYPAEVHVTIHKRAWRECGLRRRRWGKRFFEESDTEAFVSSWS